LPAADVTAVQICNGLGAGNIGDEFMARAFWDRLPAQVCLEVEVLPHHGRQREPYPSRHRYRTLDWDGRDDGPPRPPAPGLLVGDTPITESLGLDWPLRFLSGRLDSFQRQGLPVDAVGIGVEPLESAGARDLFDRHFLPIRSWTVRSPTCRESLLALGVAGDRVVLGADWAWLYRRRRDLAEWAARTWADLGIDASRPLVVANVVNEIWRGRRATKQALAAALDELERRGLQVAFFCNESREGEFYDRAAATETQTLMTRPAAVMPNLYYAPDEVLGLLSHAAVTISGRYHFTVESILAGAIPVSVVRSQKMRGLLEELGERPVGTIEDLDPEALVREVLEAVADRPSRRAKLDAAAQRLQRRAESNLALVPWAR
jgi:polysaccharide pyruvyl transferase WcaK-like protein